jgi:hypothetical protein
VRARATMAVTTAKPIRNDFTGIISELRYYNK